jgi:hypothetical protein
MQLEIGEATIVLQTAIWNLTTDADFQVGRNKNVKRSDATLKY